MAAKSEWVDAQINYFLTDFDGPRHGLWRIYEDADFSDFSADEYTMKVTFEKKPKPFQVGDRVRAFGGSLGIIDAVAAAYPGVREYWVRNPDTGHHSTYTEDVLKRVGDV